MIKYDRNAPHVPLCYVLDLLVIKSAVLCPKLCVFVLSVQDMVVYVGHMNLKLVFS